MSSNLKIFQLLILVFFSTIAFGQKKITVLELKSEIDTRSSRYIRLGLQEAITSKSDLVIIDMNTYGGALNDADSIRTLLINFPKPIWVFINNNAASAGALISIACDSIYMTKGSNIGAATVVNGENGQAMPDKYQSYMRSIMRSTAESRGRDPRIAEAMVDENIYIEGITDSTKVLTFTVSEAIKYKFCEAQVESIDELLKRNGVSKYTLNVYKLSSTEKLIAWVINPVISGFLVMIIIGGIYFELQTPGIGFPIAAALIAMALYLIPHYIHGLAANWEVAVFLVGILLLIAEIFVIPGFGIAGILGIICIIGGLALTMVANNWFDFSNVKPQDASTAMITTAITLIGTIILIIIAMTGLSSSKFMKKIAHTETFKTKDGFHSNFNKIGLKGASGIAASVLRPGGKISIDGVLYDAFSQGEFIEKDTEIIVIDDSSSNLKVKKKVS